MKAESTAYKNKRQMICEAAARLFRDKGYAATSMRDLAQAVDLKASSLYNHIGSKEEILQEICFANGRRFQQEMERVEQAGISAEEKVRALLRLHVQQATQDPTSVTAFNDEWRHLSEPHLSAFRVIRRDYEQRFHAIITAGIRQGEFRDLHPQVVLHTLFSSVRWLYDWYRPDRAITPDELADQLTAMLLGGLSPEDVKEE